MSYSSHAPINPGPSTYPPMPASNGARSNDYAYNDAESQSQGASTRKHRRTGDGGSRPGLSSSQSWDLFAGVRKGYQDFDTANASEQHLAFADGDVPKTAVRCIVPD